MPDLDAVLCPVCLHRIRWADLPLYRYDAPTGGYVPQPVPGDAGPEQKARLRRLAWVRCPNEHAAPHHLPASYGESGPPLVFGMVGAPGSGKTHLLTAMISAVERGDLHRRYGLACWPLEVPLHQRYLRDHVGPLLGEARELAPTPPGRVMFADGFMVAHGDRPPRPVALFDVAGDDLTRVAEATAFLDAAHGLIFVVDPARLDEADRRDHAFGAVLDLLRASGRLPRVSAAVVLAKADLLRYEDPVALWLRRDTATLDADESLRESADVYAYLHRREAHAWTRPYRECRHATLHVASATGSGAAYDDATDESYFTEGVHPRRVLQPLVSLLAMTGVLASPEAELIGT
ncbi:ATP-binding protein [Actinomadura terrae]|uniref:ATP-binding protein n=1 Tax=Actinomadura terrae TaxID=604353 RepID=UPI001FA6BD26|nr:ATP-binding protein [Actinomadura terrae]